MNPRAVFERFGITADLEPHGDGHINTTYIDKNRQYILQRINTDVFTDPDRLMKNIDAVTAFLRQKLEKTNGDPERETLTVVPVLDGNLCYKAEDGSVWRVYRFVRDTYSVTVSRDPRELYEAGRAFGSFQRLLADFPAGELYESIADFHNTKKRVENLKQAVRNDPVGRANGVKREIDLFLSHEGKASVVTDGIEKGEIPLRVTHNDTKINNVLFDRHTKKAICVVDLDTVMPGSALYDFGDAVRSGAATAKEDETDLSLVKIDLERFEGFAKGFLSQTRQTLTERELALLPFSAWLMTYECGCRFLTDYINGDTYFRIHREGQNLDRARCQLALAEDIERNLDKMKKLIKAD